MSVRVMAQVFEKKAGSARRQQVLLALADHADDDGGSVFPSVARLVWKTEASRRTIQRTLTELRDAHVLVIVRQATGSRPVEYRLDLSRLPNKAPFQARGVTLTPRGRHVGTPGGVTLTPEPSVETSVNRQSVRERGAGLAGLSGDLRTERDCRVRTCDVERSPRDQRLEHHHRRQRRPVGLDEALAGWLDQEAA